MTVLLAPLFVLVLFVLVFAGDMFIGALRGRDIARAVAYGIVSLLALLSLFYTMGIIR